MNRKYTTVLVIWFALCCATVVVAQEQSLGRLEQSLNAGTATHDQQLQLARGYLQVGRYYEASKLAERMLDANPDDAEAKAVLDQAARALREISQQKVEAALAAASRNGASDADRLPLADAYFGAGEYRAAAEVYGKLPQAATTRESRLRHARSLAWSSDYDRAERIYSELLREQSTPELQLEYGRLLAWMGATPASVKALSGAYQNDQTEEVVVALANARAWSGDRSAAIDLLTEFTMAHPDAAEARRLLREMQGSPELRLERADELIEREPYNLALRLERARLRYESGRYAGALRDIEFIRKHSTQPVEGLDELQRLATERRQQAIAQLDQQRRDLGSAGPDSATEMLDLAKSYADHGAYDPAIELYEAYLRLRPEDTAARINYARVLSWDRRYSSAQRQYELLLREMPDRADLRYEYAQVLSYNANFVPAIHTLRGLTDLSDNPRANLYPDVPTKAYYNLGQIYRWYGWNDTAIEVQNRALALDSDFAPARQELTLARYYRPASAYGATVSFFEDSNDFQFRRADIDGQRWISQSTAVEGSIGRHAFERGDSEASATSLSGGVRHRFEDQLMGRARVGFNIYDEGLGTRPFWGAGIDWFPNIQTRTAFDYNHYDLVYDVFTLAALGSDSQIPTVGEPLDIDDFRGRFDYRSGGFWSFLADGSYGLISDDNRREALHGLLSFRVLRSPFVALKADGRYLSYDFRSNRYWSPGDYRSIAGLIQIGQDIRDRIFWSVEAKLGKSYERDRSSDIRAYYANVTVPISDVFDIVGSYAYGKSGRFDNLFGGSGDDFVNYWQRRWYVGVRLKQLFSDEDRRSTDRYYYDNRVLTVSPVIPPVGETQ
jgi:tetratricopeptide (TPR) repeat protein